MTTARIFPAFVVIAASVVAINQDASAQSGSQAQQVERRVKADIAQATQDVATKLDELDRSLQNRPAKLTPTRWDSVLSGAQEVKATIVKIKALREQIGETTRGLSDASGRMRTALAGLEGKFSELAKEAQADADGTAGLAPMPEGLLAMVQREAAIYREGAGLCSATAQYFASALAAQKDNLAVMDRCGPMLSRTERAADHFIELAQLGKQVEEAQGSLAGFAEQLNGLLDLFERLATKTKDAVARVSPSPTKTTLPAVTYPAYRYNPAAAAPAASTHRGNTPGTAKVVSAAYRR